MNPVFIIPESACAELEQLRGAIAQEFPSLNRMTIESHPTDSGKGFTWRVMLTLTGGHCCMVTKPNLTNAVRHCIAKMQATIHEVPRSRT